MTIKLVIVDDHSMVRQSLRMFFEADGEVEIVGEARDGLEALDLARKLRPDVVLMDLLMPALDGVHATAAIRQELPDVEVVVMTSVLEEAAVPEAIEAGAISYVLKDTQPHELRNAIIAAGAGQVRLSLETAERLLRDVATPACTGASLDTTDLAILHLMASGSSNAEMAAAIGTDEAEARVAVRHMLSKLGVAGRAQAILCGVNQGLIPPDTVRGLGLATKM